MKLVAYMRVSDVSENIENQRYAILEFAARHGYQVSSFFEDVGVSGALPPLGRPGFAKAFNALKECDGMVVYALDRVARSLSELVDIVRKIEDMGKVVVSVRESWLNELDPRIRSLIVAVLGWAGEMEREFIRERTREALKRARMQGKKVGRPRKVNEMLSILSQLLSWRTARGFHEFELAFNSFPVAVHAVWLVQADVPLESFNSFPVAVARTPSSPASPNTSFNSFPVAVVIVIPLTLLYDNITFNSFPVAVR
ncbi:MAG: recombinase family protein [Thermofilaceae archaeon]|nr:recombinase family protein [Thermofilaceae archaeon]